MDTLTPEARLRTAAAHRETRMAELTGAPRSRPPRPRPAPSRLPACQAPTPAQTALVLAQLALLAALLGWLLAQARLGARPARIRKAGLLAPAEPSPSPAKTSGNGWTEPPDKADREAQVAQRLRWLARGLPPTGVALTLPGHQWRRTLGALGGLAEEIVAIERDPAIFPRLLAALRQSPPPATPVSLLHADFWAVAAAPPGPVRILDYDGMDATRPDLLDALRRALDSLTPRAVLRLTFETAQGASLDGVLGVLAARRPIEAV